MVLTTTTKSNEEHKKIPE